MVKKRAKAKAKRGGTRLLFRPRGAGSDAFILVPNTGAIKVDADSLTVGGQTVYRPRDRIAGAGALELVDVKDATPTADLYGMVVLIHPDSAALAVTGAFYQATQPVSLSAAIDISDSDVRILGRIKIRDSTGAVIDPATKGQLPAALTGAGNLKVSLQEDGGAVIGVDDNGGSLTVDGTFWQTTQPVSLATNTPDVTDRAARLVGVVSLAAGSAQVGLVKLSDGTDTALVTGSGMLNVMRSIDASRVNISIKFNSAVAPAADTICSCVKNTDGADAGAATTFAVTSGKRFRVLGMTVTCRTTTAATPWALATIRMNPSGAAVVGSPIVHRLGVGGTAAVIGNTAADTLYFTEGWEISGTQQIAITFANNVATNVTDIVLFGYEYTP